MMKPEMDGTSHERVDPEAFGEYAVRDRREIARLLQTLVERSNLVRAYVDERESFLSVLLGLTADQASIVLDASPDAELNAHALKGRELICVTRLDRVKIQFSLHPVTSVSFREQSALMAPLPDSLLRLQRREFFRVPAPQVDPLVCTIFRKKPDGHVHTIDVRVLDLSGGGLAILVPPSEIDFVPGDEFERCNLALPDGEPIPLRLSVRNLFTVEKQNGRHLKRAGCQFAGLSAAASARIQRYLFKLERDYRERSA